MLSNQNRPLNAKASSTDVRRTSPARRIRVLIADDHTILRDTLRLLLEMHDEIEIVGEACDGREAIDLAEKLKPDVVLMDTAMPGLNGIEATTQIRKRLPRTRVLALSGYQYEDQVKAALRAGASGYVLKSSSSKELLLAIHTVHQSNMYLSEALAEGDQGHTYLLAAEGRGEKDAELSPREREVLQLIGEGYTNRGIAERLFISVKTVEAHKEHIIQKVGARGSAELIRYAIRKGLIKIETDEELGLNGKAAAS
jgi:DNA-binding NarL/FixJ family response regulator